MSLKTAFLCDPIAALNPRKDSTLLLGLEAQSRGHRLYHLTPEDVCLENGRVLGWCAALTLFPDPEKHFSLEKAERLELAEFDLVLLRKNPPFDDAYLGLTYLLEKLAPETPVLNDPVSIRNFPGKIFPLEFSDYIVPYVISRQREDLISFLEKHEEVVLKPLFDYGGRGICRLKKGDGNLNQALENFKRNYNSPFIAQKFIPEAAKGDKRIILFDGYPEAAILRVPAKDGFLGNISSGATTQAAELTSHEKELCEKLGPRLRELGLFFVGLDMLGDYITEINVISTGTLRAANTLGGLQLEKTFWDRMQSHLK